ncbi:MAG TPA: heat shock protein HspQ [Candidatus Thiothrix moscowensis]|uniref:heat shock protein HspQ n=1 Tax=unclassified Thiothrix TaxID=2636184 RepID=UPI001A307C82|nr:MULTISPECIES: heat shock protein HspQ [unclassified Thiothrix]MBJ6611029.1 heat shock protein HspQ [Candidatus Thiothrix moscowensis]HRJ53463.1 heat shock protein HspQ [Candidatus Thiothrix moscowensis]HRJ93542.1 heat shock protein HspQ [Candidatus Thiothrix moscowensis]
MFGEKVASFGIGQVIHHRQFNYRGVIFDVDPDFQGTDEWFQKNHEVGNPSRDEPWYHVLIDQDGRVAYVAECNLEVDDATIPVEHPLLENFFTGFNGDHYQARQTLN